MNRNVMINVIFVLFLAFLVYMAYALVDAPAENKRLKMLLEESNKRYDSLELEKNKYLELSAKLYIESEYNVAKAMDKKNNQLKTKQEYENFINIISNWNVMQVDSFLSTRKPN